MIFRLLVTILFLCFSDTSYANSLTEDERQIGRCVGVFAYATNYALLEDNIGKAKLMVSQTARANVAMMIAFEQDGKIPEWKLRESDIFTGNLATYYQKKPMLLNIEIDDCSKRTNSILTYDVYSNKLLLNRKVSDLIDIVSSKIAKQVGL